MRRLPMLKVLGFIGAQPGIAKEQHKVVQLLGLPACQSALKFDPGSASNRGSDSNLMQAARI